MQPNSSKWFHLGLASCLALASCDNKQNNNATSGEKSAENSAASAEGNKNQTPPAGETQGNGSPEAPKSDKEQPQPVAKKVQASLEERVQAYGALEHIPADASMAFRINFSQHLMKHSLFSRLQEQSEDNEELYEQETEESRPPTPIGPEGDDGDDGEMNSYEAEDEPPVLMPDGPKGEVEMEIDKTTGEQDADPQIDNNGGQVQLQMDEEGDEEEQDFPFKQLVVAVGPQPEALANVQEILQQQMLNEFAGEIFEDITRHKAQGDDYLQIMKKRSKFMRSIPMNKLALFQQGHVPQISVIAEFHDKFAGDAAGSIDSIIQELCEEFDGKTSDHQINDISGKLLELELENLFMTNKERRAKRKQQDGIKPLDEQGAETDEKEEEIPEDRRFFEEEENYLGNMKLTDIREKLKGKKLFLWVGSKNSNAFLLTADELQKLRLAATPADSIVAGEAIGSNDANIKQHQYVTAVMNKQASAEYLKLGKKDIKDLLEVMSYTFNNDESIEILGDTRPVLDMFKQLGSVWDKYANQFEAGPADIFVSASDERLSINLTPYWIDNKGDWKKPLQFTKLQGANTAAFMAMQCSKEMRRSYSELIATCFETFYTLSSTVGKSQAAEQFDELVAVQQFIDNGLKQNGIAAWQNVNNILLDGIGSETAVVVDMQGKMPNLPGISKEQKQLAFPRFALVNSIDNRKSISDNWDGLQNNLNSIYKQLPEDLLEEFGIEKAQLPAEIPAVTRTQANGYANYFYQFPLLDNNFTPNLSLNDSQLIIASNFAFNDEIKQALSSTAGSPQRSGLYMHIDLKKIASAYTPKQAAQAAKDFDSKQMLKSMLGLGLGRDTIDLLNCVTLCRIVPEVELVSSVDAANSIKLSLNIKITPEEQAQPKKNAAAPKARDGEPAAVPPMPVEPVAPMPETQN